MSNIKLKMAGYVALANASLVIPLGLTVIYYSAGTTSIQTKFALSFLTVISTVVLIYLVLTLKKYVQSAFNFHGIDQVAGIIVVVSLLYGLNDIAATFLGPINTLNNLNVGLVTFLGLANIYFAIKFYKLEDGLFGLKKSYCILTMANGVLLASVFLSALSIIPGLISDIMLGSIFLLASKERRAFEKIS